MKHIPYYIYILLAAVLTVACGKDYQGDIDELNATHTSIEARVNTLETQVKTVNAQLSQLSVLATAVEQGLYITNVKTTDEGYELRLNNGHTLVLQLTPNGTLTPMPAVSMTQLNGLFYWTLNGQIFTGTDGKPIRSTEKAPLVKYDYTQQQWLVSIDGGATFKNINAYTSIYINDTVLMQVINNYVSQHSTTLFNQQMLYQIVYTYLQQNYKEVFNVELLDKVVVNYVDEHYRRLFNYTLLENVFTQYNFSYVQENIKVEELVNVMVAFIREHNEIFENNEVLYEIISSYMAMNKTTIFSEEMLLQVINNFIDNHQDYVNVELLTELVASYIDVHRDVVFNTETVRTLLREYVRKFYVQAFSQNILIQAISTYVIQNQSTIFNETLLRDIVSTYVQNNATAIFSRQTIVDIVNTYIREHETTVFDRDVLVDIIARYFEKNYDLFIKRTVITDAINNYLTTHQTTIIDVDMVSSIVYNYLTTYSIEVFDYDMLTQVINNYFTNHQEIIATYATQGSDIFKNVLIDDGMFVITLADGQVAKLVIYDALATLRDRVQSFVFVPRLNEHVQTDIWHKYIYMAILVNPVAMTKVIEDKFKNNELLLEFLVTDEKGNVSTMAVSGCSVYEGALSVYSYWTESAPKTIALHVKENKIGGTDIMTEFIPVDCEGSDEPDRGDIPEDPVPNDTPNPEPAITPIPYPVVDTDENCVVTMHLTGIQHPTTGKWLELYGTGLSKQNVWVEVDGTAKGISVVNLEDNTSKVKNDIVFSVDNSGSMGQEADAVANGIKQWANMLAEKGLDVKFGIVGYGYTYKQGITGAIDLTSSSEISSYLNRSTSTSRTVGYGGSNASKLESLASNYTLWKEASYENGVRAIRFANENFTFRPSSNRIYINFTDDCNHTMGNDNVSVNFFKDKTKWPVANGTIHSVISETQAVLTSRLKSTYELPWLMSEYTNGTIMFVNSNASDLKLDQLTVSEAITHSYTIRFIIPKSLLDGKSHTIRIVVISADGAVRGVLSFSTVFSL